jgi:phage replication O-like protein O
MSEAGYTKLSNLLFDGLLAKSASFSKREMVVLLAVIRFTIGWNREEAKLSCRFIAEATGLKAGHVSETVNALAEQGFISIDRSRSTTVIKLNVDSLSSVPKSGTVDVQSVPESVTVVFPNQEQKCSQIRNESVPESGTNKDSKDNIKPNNQSQPQSVPVLAFAVDW